MLERVELKTLAGTIIAVPVVNVHGFNTGDRYLPDRRDLNRSFPGSERGSLASRVAHLMMTQVVSRCSIGIDLHTGSDHRINLPQVRGDLDNPLVLEYAKVFGAPLGLHARVRDGSLREAATAIGSTALLFEGGEADRFDEHAITAGTDGCLRVMAHCNMIDLAATGTAIAPRTGPRAMRLSRSSRWVRSSRSGILRLQTALGKRRRQGRRASDGFRPLWQTIRGDQSTLGRCRHRPHAASAREPRRCRRARRCRRLRAASNGQPRMGNVIQTGLSPLIVTRRMRRCCPS